MRVVRHEIYIVENDFVINLIYNMHRFNKYRNASSLNTWLS